MVNTCTPLTVRIMIIADQHLKEKKTLLATGTITSSTRTKKKQITLDKTMKKMMTDIHV